MKEVRYVSFCKMIIISQNKILYVKGIGHMKKTMVLIFAFSLMLTFVACGAFSDGFDAFLEEIIEPRIENDLFEQAGTVEHCSKTDFFMFYYFEELIEEGVMARIEIRIYPDGIIETTYPNGRIETVQIVGGIEMPLQTDLIISRPFEAENGETLMFELRLYADGRDETIFPSGTVHTSYPDGRLEVIYADGGMQTVYPDGRVERIPAENEAEPQIEHIYQDGSLVTIETRTERVIETTIVRMYSDGSKKTIYPDGRIETIYPDGRIETIYPDGRIETNLVEEQSCP
jgi:hypothetical protein